MMVDVFGQFALLQLTRGAGGLDRGPDLLREASHREVGGDAVNTLCQPLSTL